MQNNSLAAVSLACLENGLELKKALCHLFVVQNTLLSSFNWTNPAKGIARFKSVTHTSNKKPSVQGKARQSCASELESFQCNGLDILVRAFLSLVALI